MNKVDRDTKSVYYHEAYNLFVTGWNRTTNKITKIVSCLMKGAI